MALVAGFAPDTSQNDRELNTSLKQLAATLKDEHTNIEILLSKAPLETLQVGISQCV